MNKVTSRKSAKCSCPPKRQEKITACGSVGKRIGDIEIWGKGCISYSRKR